MVTVCVSGDSRSQCAYATPTVVTPLPRQRLVLSLLLLFSLLFHPSKPGQSAVTPGACKQVPVPPATPTPTCHVIPAMA